MIMIFASDIPFFSLYNTNFVVWIGFLIFVGFLVFKGVPKLVTSLLDKRADGIRNELAEAKKLREEAQEIFADYERKLKEVEVEAEEIVTAAKANAERAADEAKVKLDQSIERRIAAGKDQIASAEIAVEREIRIRAASIAVEATREVLTKNLTGKNAGTLIDDAIKEINTNLN